MKVFTDRFQIALDDVAISDKVRVIPEPLTDLGALPSDQACLRLERTFKEVFVPTPQICQKMRELMAVALEYVLYAYPDEGTFVAKCNQKDLRREDPWFPIGLSGLGGVGKSALLGALKRLLADAGEVVAVPALPVYPLETLWTLTMRSGLNTTALLKSSPKIFSQEVIARSPDAIQRSAAKTAYTRGVALLPVDEFQFVTSTANAHAKAAKVLMELSRIGPPVIYLANFSMINKLLKRPQQERDRLLSNIKIVYPDAADTAAWSNTLTGQLNVAPEIFSSDTAINVRNDGEVIHQYSFGLLRSSSFLLEFAYRHARDGGRDIVTLKDVESAYKSGLYWSFREKIELLKKQSIDRESAGDDLWCPMAELSPTNVIVAEKAIKEHQNRAAEAYAVDSMNTRDREAYESVFGKKPRESGRKAPVVPLRKGKPTKEELMEGSAAFRANFDPGSKS